MGANINRRPLPGWRDWGSYATFSGMGAAELWAAGGSWTLCSIGRSIAGRADDFAAAVEATHATNPLHLEDYRAIVADMRRILAREVGNG